MLKYILNCILDLVYYRSDLCLCCDKTLYNEELLCDTCLKNLILCHSYFEINKHDYNFKCYSCAYYSNTIKTLILKMKYKNDFKSAEFLSGLIYNFIVKNNINIDIITFVPSSKSRKKRRGYNQSEVLAHYTSRKLKIEKKKLLLKKDGTKDQIGLSEKERWENVRDMFFFNKKYNIEDKRILLIDDVITTGATIYNCNEVLKQSGAKEVILLTVARNIG
ncbi:ComF family protein [Hathewaya histolytica]|uniref:Competence protein F n=1 Tax=Hathewaya histolytica TaxID=1498 RepID=A0A4U9RQV3_HATHI|nr:ComF family protein [Hathewaya histolytica]VTQ94058.1 competence protein F [Hathewaya histolytica]